MCSLDVGRGPDLNIWARYISNAPNLSHLLSSLTFPSHTPLTTMSPSKTPTIEWDKFYNIVGTEKRGSDSIHHGVNPVTGENLWDVPVASEQDLNDAVAIAKKAFPAWRDTPLEKRKETLMKTCDYLGPHLEDIITLLCKETGKPVRDAPSESHDPC